ncbi:hypothetical protein CSKR_202815 [Clonorchis sinensis]|uniref:Uncharacterized protein n=1 Tax=Clonorchis sinensis TaxID=79923 RepID=A0A8T1M3G7_CLOSI|nr:hypothetical protein CSKR_202815 [Clonorchis sinensis]
MIFRKHIGGTEETIVASFHFYKQSYHALLPENASYSLFAPHNLILKHLLLLFPAGPEDGDAHSKMLLSKTGGCFQ